MDEHKGFRFIAMEYVPGKSFEQLIGPEGLPADNVLNYAAQIADALAKAHSAGIVHRNLKPSNIMVNREGVVELVDFSGWRKPSRRARHVAERVAHEEALLTGEGAILGTLQYMAPSS